MGLRFYRGCRPQPMPITISRDPTWLAFLASHRYATRGGVVGAGAGWRSAFVAIAVPHPVLWRFRVLISPFGNQVEVVISGVHHVDSARVGGARRAEPPDGP